MAALTSSYLYFFDNNNTYLANKLFTASAACPARQQRLLKRRHERPRVTRYKGNFLLLDASSPGKRVKWRNFAIMALINMERYKFDFNFYIALYCPWFVIRPRCGSPLPGHLFFYTCCGLPPPPSSTCNLYPTRPILRDGDLLDRKGPARDHQWGDGIKIIYCDSCFNKIGRRRRRYFVNSIKVLYCYYFHNRRRRASFISIGGLLPFAGQ